MLTPDSIRRGVAVPIIGVVTTATRAQMLFSKRLLVVEETVRFLYPRLVTRSFFPSIVRNYISGDSLVIFLQGASGLNGIVNGMKGRFHVDPGGCLQTSGLRQRHGASIEERNGEVFEFLLHTSDNHQEARMLASAFLTYDDPCVG